MRRSQFFHVFAMIPIRFKNRHIRERIFHSFENEGNFLNYYGFQFSVTDKRRKIHFSWGNFFHGKNCGNFFQK